MQKSTTLVCFRYHAYQWLLVFLTTGLLVSGAVQAEARDNEQVPVQTTMSESIATANSAQAALADIINYRQYSPVYASSGQPAREQFESLKAAGFDRIVYIAFSHNGRAISDEDKLVKALGMGYLHIPVDFDSPQVDEFETFAAYLQAAPSKKTLLHCQVNYRATAFSFLYRVIYGGVPVAEAKADMNTVWQPDAVWRDFIFAVLGARDISPVCESCDWTPPKSS
jgi:protein tyrosine phosphatase (PTP) superfamily phosphohydrolase (DUF442 family)